MMPDPVLLFATVILLLPMGYCLLAAPAFLLVRLDIPPVTALLRRLFNAYFLLLAIAGVIGAIAFAVEGRLAGAVGIGLIAAFAILGRAGFCAGWMPISMPGTPAIPMRCGGCAGCIGVACCAMRSSLSRSWAASPMSWSRRHNQVRRLNRSRSTDPAGPGHAVREADCDT
jgi:hypothetical protein